MPGSWPFADPENVAVFTLRRIVEGKSWVLRVCHDEEDGAWQFLDGGEVAVDAASVVSLRTMTDIDASLLALADLPVGWVAKRSSPGQPWQRAPAISEGAQAGVPAGSTGRPCGP